MKTPIVWSATPTPLTDTLEIDQDSVRRMMAHHIACGCDGVMLGGTCGEGPWLRDRDLEALVRTGLEAREASLRVAVQVTDNSPGRILDRLDALARWGVDLGVLAQPYFFMNATPARLRAFYLEVLDRSPLPIAFYDRGKGAAVPVPQEILGDILRHENVKMVKDSSVDAGRFEIMKAVAKERPEILVLTGAEFRFTEDLDAGFDGAFFGGAVVTARAVRQCQELRASGAMAEAEALDHATREVLFAIYGGPSIACWLSGLKYALVRLGLFSSWHNIPGYPLTEDCRAAIDRVVREVPWLRA